MHRCFWPWPRTSGLFLIKLADRLHNLRTLKYHPVPKQQEIAQKHLKYLPRHTAWESIESNGSWKTYPSVSRNRTAISNWSKMLRPARNGKKRSIT